MAKEMTERKLKSKLLSYYLVQADFGDKEAEKMAVSLGKMMKDPVERTGGKTKKVKVIFPSGKTKIYESRKEVSAAFDISKNTIAKLISDGIAHSSGIKFENYVKGIGE